MVRVPISPPLPITKRHSAEKSMGWIEVVRCRHRESLDPSNGARQISGELRWFRPFCPAINSISEQTPSSASIHVIGHSGRGPY